MTILAQLTPTLGWATRLAAGDVRYAALYGSSVAAKEDADRSTGSHAERIAESIMVSSLREAGLHMPIIGEEHFSGLSAHEVPGIIDPDVANIFVDPTDGTAGQADGALTSFCAAFYYDPRTGEFSAAATDMHGRTFEGSGRLIDHGADHTQSWANWQEYDLRTGIAQDAHVPLLLPGAVRSLTPAGEKLPDGAAKPNALIEISHGFLRRHALDGRIRPVLTTAQAGWLQRMLQDNFVLRTSMRDSNIGHGCTVALGRQAALTVMTAIGGPWDLCGVFIALAAGATVVLFRRNKRGELEVIDFSYPNWLYEVDMVLTAATPEIARQATPNVIAAARMHG